MILSKPIEDMTLQEMFQVVMEQYREAIETPWGSANPSWNDWQKLKAGMAEKIKQNSDADFTDTYIVDPELSGAGNWSNVFGLSVRHKSVPSVKKGVYITYLFHRSSETAYLTLSQGADEYRGRRRELREHVKNLRNRLGLGAALTGAVDCGKADYNDGVIASKKYTLAALPDDDVLYQDLKDMLAVYEQYLSGEAAEAAPETYTDEQLCRILSAMLDETQEISRKNAALAVFGAVYGEFINKDNTQKLLDVTARTGTRSNKAQLDNGYNLYKLCQNTPGMDLFEVLAARTADAAELQGLLADAHTAAPANSKIATTIRFGIQYSKIIAANNILPKDIYGDGGHVALGYQIAELVESFPNYKIPLKKIPPYANTYADILRQSKNVIFRGAPGTGKTYLARNVAAVIISDGEVDTFEKLSEAQKKQFEFVQFHPSYDYSDFVEGLRPVEKSGTLGFELRDGIFKAFVDRARKNFENAKEESDKKYYVFIIDEINRGEISKILGELFFAIDPGYRGEAGAVLTQYANLHKASEGKFYIPENVYIIGTMNDIDRSVDTFDFAMRRRFRFVEIDADSNIAMLGALGDKEVDAVMRMRSLNKVIEEKLNKNYQIGAAYFLKLKDIDFAQLWTDHLAPLLQEYVNGAYDDKEQMKLFYEAYELKNAVGDPDDATE